MSNTTNLQVTYRNVADIASAMQKFQENAMPSIGEYQQILKNIKNSKSDGLTNINIRNYFADVHYLINDTILTTFDAITSIITLYAYDLEKYDGSKDFIVIQSELEKKYPKYQHISDTFSSNHVIIKSAYDSISEYIDEGLLDVSNITSRLEDMHLFFETMYQQIYDEGSSYGDKLIEINELLINLQKVIDKAMEIKITEYDFSQLSNIDGINELNDSLFNIQNFFSNEQLMEKLDEAAYSLEAYKRLKDAEAKRKSLIIDIAKAVLVTVGSIAFLAATGGVGAAILIPAIAVTSAVDVGFKVSEVVENDSVIHKSRKNDMSPGFNPIRKMLFNGNQEAYDFIKALNGKALEICQFASIFAGGVGLIDGWKSASTIAQKGLAVLKAGGKAGFKIGKYYGENYLEDTVAPDLLSRISSYNLMRQGYSKEAAQRIGDNHSNVLMSLYGLRGSVKGAISGVQKYKQAKRERAVVGDKEIIGKANSIRRNDDIEITPRKKYDTSNCEDLRNRLANTKNNSNPKNKVNKPKTEIDGKTNKKEVNHNQPDIITATNKEHNPKHKKEIKDNKSQNVEVETNVAVNNRKSIDDIKYNREKVSHENHLKAKEKYGSFESITPEAFDKMSSTEVLDYISEIDTEVFNKVVESNAERKEGPYLNNKSRPTHNNQQKEHIEKTVYEKTIEELGYLGDANTGDDINWKPGEPRLGVVDLGHKKGMEYRKVHALYKHGWITLDKFKSICADPYGYQLEKPGTNRSHKYEQH